MAFNRPLHHPHESLADHRPAVSLTRTRSGRMWSDPVPATHGIDLARLRPFNPDLYPAAFHGNRPLSPIAAAVCRDVPLRPLPPAPINNYRRESNNVSRFNNNIIDSIHDTDLYEDDHHDFDPYSTQPTPRMMRQAPQLLTLDDYNLISLGYKPVMPRRLPWVSLAGIAITSANVFAGVIPLYGLSVTNGGPAWATWSYLCVGVMSIIVTLCLSELASAYPTAAGIHHWVYQLGSARRRAFLSWMVGWFTIVSAVTVTASVAFYFSSVLNQLLLSIRNITLTPATQVMFHLGVLFAWQILNLLPVHTLGHLSVLSGFFFLGLAVALISVLLSLAGLQPSMGFVPFTAFLNYSGSSSGIYALLSSTLMAAFVFCPQDTVIRMSEESRRPEKSMARLMMGSTLTNIVIGIPVIVALNYCAVKPIKGLLDESVPGIKAMLETLGNSTGTIFVSLVLVAIFGTGFTRLAMATRTVYAFARDGGVPHSSYWNHLHPQRKTPQRVSWLVSVACMCCIFPFFWGNSVAFQWIASLGCISANLCFVIPLWMRLTHEGSLHYIPGVFSLGRLSKAFHIISIVWLLLLSLLLMLPSTMPLTKNNFNYAPVVLIALAIVFAISWFKARTDFTGGAKDISRASHRMPQRPLEEIYPRKPNHPGNLETGPRLLAPFRQAPTHTTMQRSKVPFGKKTRVGQAVTLTPATGAAAMRQQRQPKQQQQQQRVLRSTAPPKASRGLRLAKRFLPDLATFSSSPSAAASKASKRNQLRGQASNVTMTTIASNQSFPSSVLGIPFSESPEMMSQELPASHTRASSSPTTSRPPSNSVLLSQDIPTIPTPESTTDAQIARRPDLLLSRTVQKRDKAALPEISIAPPTTNSTGESTSQGSLSFQKRINYPHGPGPSAMQANEGSSSKARNLLSRAALQNSSRDHITISNTAPAAAGSRPLPDVQRTRPPNAIESIFRLGLGLSHSLMPAGGNHQHSAHEDYVPRGKIRSSKDRAPTPYPSSLVDAEESSAISEYPSTNEDSPLAPAFSLTVSHPRNKEYSGAGYAYDDVEEDKREVVMNIEEAVESTGISQYPTLDGYPLIKSPSTVGEDIARSSGRNNSGSGGSGGKSDTLALPSMLPLTRTPTIQQADQTYDPAFKLADSDEEGDEDGEGHDDNAVRVDPLKRLEPTGNGKDLELVPLPVTPISTARLQALSPDSRSAPKDGVQPASSSLFLLPNSDISATTPVVAAGGGGAAASSAEEEHMAAVRNPDNTADPQLQQDQQQPRRDPMERLLRMSRQQEELDPAQNFLQRTRTVASWAKDQARIQERRNKRQARAQALRELRKQDPSATLSVHTDSSSFSDRSASSVPSSSASSSWPRSMPTQSSIGSGKKILRDRKQPQSQLMMRRRSLGVGVGVGGGQSHALEALKEDELMELRRVEMVVPEKVEEEEEEEEEPGLYMDTDDVLSPSLEVDSLGAGVGRA
ncbi:hypothetical protein BGZ72_000246 [Mortierella alpina]|nr:hypothetical protein BGZ72_000246 [Mortierella alpina]